MVSELAEESEEEPSCMKMYEIVQRLAEYPCAASIQTVSYEASNPRESHIVPRPQINLLYYASLCRVAADRPAWAIAASHQNLLSGGTPVFMRIARQHTAALYTDDAAPQPHLIVLLLPEP